MAIGSTLSDFVGYRVGVLAAVPPATVGFLGLLDFSGISVGVSNVIPPPVPVLPRSMGARYSQQFNGRRRRQRREDDEIIILS